MEKGEREMWKYGGSHKKISHVNHGFAGWGVSDFAILRKIKNINGSAIRTPQRFR